MKKFQLAAARCALFLACCLPYACQKENAHSPATGAEVADRSNGNAAVFAPAAHPYGKSYAQWSVRWWQEFMTYDCENNPFYNSDNVLFYESGPVYFLAGLAEEGASVDLTVPHGKALLFPLFNFINDYPCPDETFEPAPGQTLEEFLQEGATSFLDLASGLSVTVDGAAVNNPGNYAFVSNLFYFTGHASLPSCFDICVTGSSQPAVSSGYFMMLKPLSKGEHTVHYHVDIPAFGAVQDGTFNITVE